MLSVQVSEGRKAIEAIAEEWDAFVEGSFTTTFSRSAWCLAWLDAFVPQRLAVITARAHHRLVGVLPLVRIRTDARGLFLTLVTPLPAARADYQPPIVDPDMAPVVLPAMLDAALRYFGRHGVYWWPRIPASDPSLEVLRAYLAAHDMPYAEERETTPRLRLVGETYTGAEKFWHANHRIDVRRRRKRLAEQGPVSLWQPATLAEAETALAAFFQVYDEKWVAQGYPGRFQDGAERRFYQSLVQRLWGRGLHFSTVRCGSTDVSYHFGFLSGGWLQWYRSAYRPEFAAFSPGKVHLALLVEEGYREQWKGIDFLLGTESYKLSWSNESGEVVYIHAGFSKWSPSYLWFTQGKPLVRSRLQRVYLRARAWAQQSRRRLLGIRRTQSQEDPSAMPTLTRSRPPVRRPRE
jgi:CelD/BcsL family acetyltransferase involved in cellulose biosynthesis